MARTRPSSPSETGADFLLTRFLDNINIPSTMEEDSRSKKSPLRLAKNTTTQDPDAPFTIPSRSSKTTFTYKDRNFITELEVRGVVESEEAPSDLDGIVKMLKRNSPGLQSLDELTTETFENCRIVPGNEPTIQIVIVPGLINLYGIIRDNTTHAAVEAQFVAECVLPLLPEADDDGTKITPPDPDLVVGLRRTLFQDYYVVLRQLDTIAAPITCTPAIVFPCFTVEVKGGSGASDARNQNCNNAAHMLRHLRLLSCQARGEQYTQESFDGVVRVLSATVTQDKVTISGHWTISKSGHVYTYSYLLKSASIEDITNKQWNEVSRYLQNGIKYIIQKTRQQVEDNLKYIKDSGSSRKRRRS
ncbi:unnamed protein product [Penicillium palitans]